MKLSAVIFDLNGTIIKDDDVWTSAYERVLKMLGVKNTKKYNHVCGVSVDRNWEILLSKYGIKTDKTIQELSSLTNNEYLKSLDNVEVNKGFEELVQRFSDSDIPIGLATSSSWNVVDKTFEATGIEGCFDFVTTGEEVTNSKPSPDTYDLAAEKMGIEPSECLVFEDSPAGVESAKAAGMKVIGVHRDKTHRRTLSEADDFISNFEKVTPKMIADI